MVKNKKYNFGLLPTPDDYRDFSLAGIFGAVDVRQVPMADFIVAKPKVIKDQGRTDMCTAFGLSVVVEAQESAVLSPDWAFAQIKKLRGEWTQWGADLRSACKVAKKIGLIKHDDSPLWYTTTGRDFVANWKNWDKFPELKDKAAKHKKESFFKVDGPNDRFDNIRVALWQHRDEKRVIYTGCTWRNGWMRASGGIIPVMRRTGGYGHAFAVIGQKVIKGIPYLIVQNSYGPNVGDNGLFYFPRKTVNREFKFRSYMFKDMPIEIAKDLNEKALTGTMYKPSNYRFWGWLKTLLTRPQ